MTRAAVPPLAAVLALVLAGCASAPPYRVDLSYDPVAPAAQVPGAGAVVVGLVPAVDARGLSDPAALGRRITMQDQVEPMMPAGARAEAVVTEALRTHLVQAGFPVRPVAAWDLRPETLDPAWGGAVLGAEVLEFWTEARSEALRPTRIASRARIRLVLGDPKAKRVVWTNTVESASEQEVARFSARAAERNANEALGGAIRSLVESPDLRDRLTALR